MKFTFVTLFRNIVEHYFCDSILKRATEKKLIDINFLNPRDFSKNRYKKVDDYMIGGGAGLLMSAQPLDDLLMHLKKMDKNVKIIFSTPVGKKFTQQDAKRLSNFSHLCFVCGRYEGIDERIYELFADELFCIGDFVLTGGELPALCMCDAISRNIGGVLGNSNSLVEESFENTLLEAPSFTKPDNFQNLKVVSEFLKGNHSKIKALKDNMAICKTRFHRPDLYIKSKSLNKGIK
ncbi:tRNA (guanosine(37)-N1)-methyltransferase TrmD [Campylobacter sputorum]|uniref:tRNA (guanosine(37)-N1)-methyltransferase TrmD n=1 Tax=Campylobacter sputorum TaxID=206 RepID=UPI001E4A7A43|nr:tRNA (guanosine(37)-N1)-methyltransferase TrmD [Campylobacter sputorum]